MEKSFKDLGVNEQLIKACDSLGWKCPTNIQIAAIPLALQGEDIMAIARTGSGKTGSFAIPIIQSLLAAPQPFFACVVAPTSEFAFRIARQFEALGAGIGLKCALLMGGVGQQSIALENLPHVVVATPGCLVDHLSNTKGFSLRTLKYFVVYEALSENFQESYIDAILSAIPGDVPTSLFSSTTTNKIVVKKVNKESNGRKQKIGDICAIFENLKV